MKKIVSTTWLVLLLLSLNAQTIPVDRRVNWQQITKNYAYKTPVRAVSIMDFGGVADGKTDNSNALKQAVASFQNGAGTVLFPAGSYLFNSTIALPDSIQLKGAGSDVTVLKFDLNQQPKNCISITGTAENHFVRLKGGYSFGSSKLLSDSASYFHAGDWVEILEDNGSWNTVPADWAKNSVGQIAKVKAVSGDTIILRNPLRITYLDSLNPRLQRMNPVKNVAVSCLKIIRLDKPTEGGGYNIFMDYAVNSRLAGLESDTSSGSHVYINRSAQIRVEGNYFHHAFAYDGVSTHGYGVTLAHHSGGCLIVNNIFVHLRHAMMVKTGANGNVFAYNYSRDPFRSESFSDLSGDISLHGHYPFANLLEGNIIQNIIIDHYWGPSGPLNTFFRNRAELWGIIMTQSDTTETSEQNFVGNECTNTSFLHGQFALKGTDNFVYANNILGIIIPASSGELSDSSYYLLEKPDFWETDEPWPDIGLPDKLGTGVIPAKQRFENGGVLTVCPEDVTEVRKHFAGDAEWQIWPNPVRGNLYISLPSGDKSGSFSVRIFDIRGALLSVKKYEKRSIVVPMDENWRPGIYLLEISSGKSRFLRKIVLVR
ncbi:hypothetical protein MNBD_BACTEROID07-1019 [hydrothermal vent metagenome]|uniref:Pectate lyase superfamily protein domain-containing protein n=1 Tax=hydrothermal vent metagenome TaxID=652676 RepID=A0A3B0UQ25_9ZZZZ